MYPALNKDHHDVKVSSSSNIAIETHFNGTNTDEVATEMILPNTPVVSNVDLAKNDIFPLHRFETDEDYDIQKSLGELDSQIDSLHTELDKVGSQYDL